MPSSITMAPHSGAKLLPMLPASAKPRAPASLLPSALTTTTASTLQQLVASSTTSSSSASVLSKSLLQTASSLTATSTTTSSNSPSATTSVSTISIPVSAFHDPNSNVITITPYIFVKTATVAEQMQALRQDKKLPKQVEPAGTTGGALRVKRRADISSKLGLPDAKPASVSRRNARERNRVKQVNLGFETLREHVPNGKKNKKMSKVQTLRSAAQYIKDLYMILHGELPELGSPADIDETEPSSPLDNSMCSVSDTDNDFNVGSPEQQHQQQQLQQSQLLEQSEQMLMQQESLIQQKDQQDHILNEQKQQLVHQPQQLMQGYEEQLFQLQQQQQENQLQQKQIIRTEQQLFQTLSLVNQPESMDTKESEHIAMSSSSAPSPITSPIFRHASKEQDSEMQDDPSNEQVQRQLHMQQQQQHFSQLQQQKELQQKLLRQHQEQQKKKQLLQLQREEKQQEQLERQQEKQQNLLKSQMRQQKQRTTQIRQKQQPLILKKESLSVLQQQLNRGNISQLQRLQAHLHDQAQQLQQTPTPQPQQQTVHLEQQQQQQQQQQQLQQPSQQINFDPSAVRTDAMTCSSTNFGFSRSASTSSDVQLPDTPLSVYAASGNVSGNSPIPGSPLVFGGRKSHGESPLPGTPVTFTELSPVSLEDDQCENYMNLTSNEPSHPIPLQNHQHQTTISDFVRVDQPRGMQQFGLSARNQLLSDGCNDTNGVDVPTSPSMLQPTSYINDNNMNIITTPPPNPTDFEALHTYYKAIHTEHFIKSMNDDDFAFDHRNISLNSNNIINNNSNNNNNTETTNNNVLNSSSQNSSISSNNSSIAAILNNTSNIVNTLLNNNSLSNYLNLKNNSPSTTNSKLTHSPAPSLESNSSVTSSDVDLTITGNSVCYNSNNNNNNGSCYDDNGGNNIDTYDNLDGEALQDISNWISELCNQGMHGADIGHSQQMTMAYSH